jgi:single-strand DNA-binding protein
VANGNQVVLVGNLTDDPELRFTPGGVAVASFRIAVNRAYVNREGQRSEDTDYFRVNVWRQQAEHVAESLTKGARVVVVGRLRSRTYETADGEKRTAVEVEAEVVGVSLQWATARPERVPRVVEEAQPEPAEVEA